MTTKNTKKNKSKDATSSSLLSETASGSGGKNRDMVSTYEEATKWLVILQNILHVTGMLKHSYSILSEKERNP